MKRGFGRAALVFINVITDPVVVTSLVAPFVIVTALRLAKASLVGRGEETLVLFNHATFPGIVDYIIQLYSAVLSYGIFVLRGFVDVGIPLITRWKEANKEETFYDEHPWHLGFVLYGIVIIFVGAWLFFFGGASNVSVVASYAERKFELGDMQLPVVSRILWIRFFIGAGGVWLMWIRQLDARKAARSSGENVATTSNLAKTS